MRLETVMRGGRKRAFECPTCQGTMSHSPNMGDRDKICPTVYARKRARREWRKPRSQAKSRNRSLIWRYGIDEAFYQDLLDYGTGGCWCCGYRPGPGERKLHVDHDHSTKMIRGILCAHCNTGLGLFGDSVERLQQAIRYIQTETPLKVSSEDGV